MSDYQVGGNTFSDQKTKNYKILKNEKYYLIILMMINPGTV